MENRRSLDNIVVVGGGTAGWLTALYAKKCLPLSNVTVVESDEIGILGAGEGTTPSFVTFLDHLNIPVSRLLKETSTTIKTGIKFTNWNGDGTHYYHGFSPAKDLSYAAMDNSELLSRTSLVFATNAANGKHHDEITFAALTGELGKAPFRNNEEYQEGMFVPDPILKFLLESYYGVHFDASKIALVLRNIAEERGINRVEGIVEDIVESSDGDIQTLVLGSGQTVDLDFMFDCTGFARVFAGKKYQSEWKSHKDLLPVDTAVPFFLPMDEAIPPYTEAIAMKYGWMWKIPLQHRYGCGYVFDSSFINEEEAKEEIQQTLGMEIESPRTFKFNAGYFKTPWNRNCISVGLASGFIEPLEATSIWVTIMTLMNALSNVENLASKDPRIADEFNAKFCEMNDQVVDFLYFHYMSERNDTDFWKKFKSPEAAPEKIQKMLNTWSYRVPEYRDFFGGMFLLESWLAVGSGVGQLNYDAFKYAYESNMAERLMEDSMSRYMANMEEIVEGCLDHRQFIEAITS